MGVDVVRPPDTFTSYVGNQGRRLMPTNAQVDHYAEQIGTLGLRPRARDALWLGWVAEPSSILPDAEARG